MEPEECVTTMGLTVREIRKNYECEHPTNLGGNDGRQCSDEEDNRQSD